MQPCSALNHTATINHCTASKLESRCSFRVLPQIGNTYDAVGIDALLLVEFCKVNFRGSNLNVPSAGCRVGDLPQLLEILVEKAGVNVVSWKLFVSGGICLPLSSDARHTGKYMYASDGFVYLCAAG
jgi:hypothetical protein